MPTTAVTMITKHYPDDHCLIVWCHGAKSVKGTQDIDIVLYFIKEVPNFSLVKDVM